MAKQETITAAMLAGHRLEWTTLKKRKAGYEVADQQRVELALPDEGAADAPDIGAAIKKAMGTIKGHLTVVIHTEQALMRVVDLPDADADERAGMVELQVDKFSPFATEQMAIGHEVLGAFNDTMRVLIAACKRDAVQEQGDLFEAAGRLPDRIDVAATGWWRLILNHGAVPDKGRHGVLLVDETGAELVITQDGMPVVVRSLGGQGDLSDEQFFGELAEESGYTLTSLESEWGSIAMADLTLWYRGEAPALLLEKIRAECSVEVKVSSLDELPYLTEGVAYRTAKASDRTLDLALYDWREAARSRIGQRRMIIMVASVLLVWGAALAGLFILSHLDRVRIEALRAEITALEGPAEEARLLRRRVASLEQYADRTYSVLEVLREVTELMPGELELSSFTYRKAGQVNLRGDATRVPPILDFFEAMEASELFVDVSPEGVTQAPGGRRNPEFRLTASLPGDDGS